MRQGINVLYRNAAEQFATRVVSELGDAVQSIVLFGSVARKQAKRDSDIDVLVVGSATNVRDRVMDIAYEVMEASSFEVFISVVYLSRDEFQELARLGSPLAFAILEEGTILYDNGTFARVRGAAVSVGRRGAKRRKVSSAG